MNAPLSNIKDWSEKHEIGADDSRILERAVEFYLDAVRSIERTCGIDYPPYVIAVRDLRDKIVSCHSIRIIPDEDQ